MNLDSLLASFASAFNQDQRLLTLELGTGQIAAEQLLPLSLDGEEGVSQAYRHVVTCLSPDGAIELKTLLGQNRPSPPAWACRPPPWSAPPAKKSTPMPRA
ncbi:hypothetical protein, partial [Chromobacterium phragmitis]